MRKYDLVSCDFDGTLLRSDGTVSERAKETVKRFVESGGIFVLNTGRVIDSAVKMVKELGLSGAVSACQGGIVLDVKSGEIIRAESIPVVTAVDVISYLEGEGLHVQGYPVTGGYVVREKNDTTRYYSSMCLIEPTEVGKSLAEYVEENQVRLLKILAICYSEPSHHVRVLEKQFGDKLNVCVSTEDPWFLEVNDANTSKGNSHRALSERFGVPIERTVAFGDQSNDISMIEAAGTGVAVGNACRALKERADVVVESNDEDGVARFMEKYCFSE